MGIVYQESELSIFKTVLRVCESAQCFLTEIDRQCQSQECCAIAQCLQSTFRLDYIELP